MPWQSQVLRFTKIILKYPKDDAITLRSVFSTGNIVLDTLPLFLYYELLMVLAIIMLSCVWVIAII